MTVGTPTPAWTHRHLLDVDLLTRAEIERVLDLADQMRTARETREFRSLLDLETVALAFYEPSTRTRVSFELAAKRLSAEAINIAASSSSTTKGETLLDTGRNLQAMHPDAIVVRHAFGGAAAMLAKTARCAVINAGDGQHEHPTQALLDAATIRRHRGGGHGRDAFENLEVAIVGDIQHSRVARSNILCLSKLGARVRLVAPWTLIPRGIELIGGELTRERVRLCPRLEDGLDGADVVMMLRVQHERFDGEASRFPNTRELSRTFGLSERTLAYAKNDAIVMHPGPINRGVEVSPQVADGPRAVILQQVSWGVAIRMAVLERCILGDLGDDA